MSQKLKKCFCFQPTFFFAIALICLGILSFNYWDLYVGYNNVFQQLQEAREKEQVAYQKRDDFETYAEKMKIDLYELREEFDRLKFEFGKKDQSLQEKNKELVQNTEEVKNLTNRLVELNKKSSELETCENELQGCLKDSKDKEENNSNLEAEVSTLKGYNNQLKEKFEILRKRIPEGILEDNKIMQEFQQIGVAQNQKDTQFERDRLESEEEQINSNKDGIINTKSTLKRKLLSLDNSGYYDQWKPANENSNIYNEKLSSSLYKYEQPLEEIISYSVDNVDYTQKVENIPVVSPYRPRVKVPLPLTVFSSGNTLDSQKTRFSNTNVPLSQQQDLQAHDENSQLLPGMSVQSDDYRLSEKRPNDIIYSKFVDLHNALEGSHDKISTDGSQTTSFISGQNNRAMLNDIRGSLERSYHSVDWKENAQKLTVNDSEEQNKNERYVRPWETQDKRKTEDFNWKQSDYAQNNKLKVQLKDSQLENKSMSQPVFDSYTEIGLKLSEKMDDTAPAQNLIHRKRERELALLDNISNILNKVRIQLNYVQSYLHRFPGNNNWYPMGTQRYRPLEHSYNNGYSVNAQEQNYYNRYPTETQPQTYHKHKVKGVQSYGNYRNVENALESALDRGTAGFQRKRPLWLELLQRSLIPEVEKDKNPESVFSSKENQYSGNVLSSNFFNPKNALDFSLQNEVQEKSNLPNQSLNSYETLQISDAFNTSRMNGSDVIQLEKTHQRSEVPGYIFDTRKVDAGKLESDEEREEIKDERSSNLRKWESSDEYNEEKSSNQQTNNDETNSNLLWNIKDETSYNQRNGESGINREKSNKKRQWYELFSNKKIVNDDSDEDYNASSFYYYDEEGIQMNQNHNSNTDIKLANNDNSYNKESE